MNANKSSIRSIRESYRKYTRTNYNSRNLTDLSYEGAIRPDEDPADYYRYPRLKGVRVG